jgi:predicted kinase
VPTVVVFSGPPGTGKSTLASAASQELGGAPVLGWDWVMASLTRFDDVQATFRQMDALTYIDVGWSIMWNVTIEQLRDGRSVVLDGVARSREIARTRQLAAEESATCLVVATHCSDVELHRSRIEGRVRAIPGWHELTWSNVAGFLDRWEEPDDVDLRLDAADDLVANVAALRARL